MIKDKFKSIFYIPFDTLEIMGLWMFLFMACFLAIVHLNVLEEIKLSTEMEVLEMDYLNNEYLHQTCRNKQPVYFQLQNGWVLPDSHYLCSFDLLAFSEKYGKEIISLYESPQKAAKITLEKACPLFTVEPCIADEQTDKDTGGDSDCSSTPIWSEHNESLINETPLKRYMKSCDVFLAPFGTIYTEYDFWLGCKGATMPLRFHHRHSYFLLVLKGEITIQLAPYKYHTALGETTPNHDYIVAHPNTQDVKEHVPWMEVIVYPGNCLFVPPYWWHQVAFVQNSEVVVFMYDNLLNTTITWGTHCYNDVVKPHLHI